MNGPVSPRPSLVRASAENAALLSIVWLALATAVEVARRYTSWRWPERVVLAIEAFPTRLLDVLGLVPPMREAFVHGQLAPWQVRVVLGLVTVAVIAALALGVGLVMGGLARLARPTSRVP